MKAVALCSAVGALVLAAFACLGSSAALKSNSESSGYRVLNPIHRASLTVFPVVASASHDTSEFLTLDEGLRSGEVEVTELGSIQPLVRRRMRPLPHSGAEVNRLVLVNNSDRPLILLAGEIVTGGKQDRIIGKDRIVPANSEPIDVNVFCVEPGRWTGDTAKFGAIGAQMAQPAVRAKAMSDKDQAKVWSEVRNSSAGIAGKLSPTLAAPLAQTSSYAQVVNNDAVKEKVESISLPLQRDYEGLIRELRNRNAVGVVVAVNGRIIWADLFASSNLLEKYWPKLVRSYAAEALSSDGLPKGVTMEKAQAFLDNMQGTREMIESEPGVYRHAEITGDAFKVFELTSLLPKTGFDVHLAKMVEQ